ncbi:hypothetical protein [Flavobacterium indicum]|nr:hypothetical protein [Flavobacterium indicum]
MENLVLTYQNMPKQGKRILSVLSMDRNVFGREIAITKVYYYKYRK